MNTVLLVCFIVWMLLTVIIYSITCLLATRREKWPAAFAMGVMIFGGWLWLLLAVRELLQS